MNLQIKGMRFKVSKKHEKLSRALAQTNLLAIGFPSERIQERVDESWMVYLDQAKAIQLAIDCTLDNELTGFTSLEEIAKWRS